MRHCTRCTHPNTLSTMQARLTQLGLGKRSQLRAVIEKEKNEPSAQPEVAAMLLQGSWSVARCSGARRGRALRMAAASTVHAAPQLVPVLDKDSAPQRLQDVDCILFDCDGELAVRCTSSSG